MRFLSTTTDDADLKTDCARSEVGESYFSEMLNGPKAIYLIAEEDNKVAGYLIAAPKSFNYRLSKYIEIENMGVSPKYRSQGIGFQLINRCIGIAKERGFQKIYVNAYFGNDRAIAFYEKCGLKKIDISLERDI